MRNDSEHQVPMYYNGKKIRIEWECSEFNLVEVRFLDNGKTIIIDKQAISASPIIEPYISINLLQRKVL